MSKGTIFKIAVGVFAVLGVVFAGIVVFYVMVYRGIMSIEPGEPGDLHSEFIVDHPPQWTPDGNHIAFSHGGAVYVVDSAGSRLQLVDGDGSVDNSATSPSVSPDGSRIAYSAYKQSGSWEIMTARPDGSDQHSLTENDTPDINPVWSPDGTRIFFRSFSSNYTWGFYVMAADGSDSSSRVKVVDAGGFPVAGSPVLSPDGSHLAFVIEVYQPPGWVMYAVGTDGSGLTKIEDQTSLPAWSPDSQRIAFAKRDRRDVNYPRDTVAGIYTIGLDGSEPQEIISFPSRSVDWAGNISISWSRDGSQILFGSYVIEADGSGMQKLTGPGNHASWSPDGSRIAVYNYYVYRQPPVVLYTVARDGMDARVLVEQNEDGSLVAAEGRPLR